MSYDTNAAGNGVLYVGNVKWNKDYAHVMLFSSKSARNTFFTGHLTKISDTVVAIDPASYVDINGTISGVENCNYLYYKNDSSLSSSSFCCFINRFEFIAPNVTRLYIEIDIFQQYFYDTDFRKSFIERATVKPSVDTVGAFTQSEPFNVHLLYEHKLDSVLTSADWDPQWVLHATSKYNSNTDQYEYSGEGSGNTFGEYGHYIDNLGNMQQLLHLYGRESMTEVIDDILANYDWKQALRDALTGIVGLTDTVQAISSSISLAMLQDHRNELIGLYAIPKWARSNNNIVTNTRVSKTKTLTIPTNVLANGYAVRNKKMLTSICRAFLLVNKNGFSAPLKPELFSSNTSTLTISAIPMGTSGYQYELSNYADIVDSHGEIPYASERRVGFDQNTGLNKILNFLGAEESMIKPIFNAGAQVASGVKGENATQIASGFMSYAFDVPKGFMNAIDQLGTKNANIGSNGDLLRITDGWAQLHFYEIEPNVDECRALDDFFDVYGYTINETDNFTSSSSKFYFKSRPNWNFIKTNNISCDCHAPADYDETFKRMFNSGITLWHNYSTFGDYSQNNV